MQRDRTRAGRGPLASPRAVVLCWWSQSSPARTWLAAWVIFLRGCHCSAHDAAACLSHKGSSVESALSSLLCVSLILCHQGYRWRSCLNGSILPSSHFPFLWLTEVERQRQGERGREERRLQPCSVTHQASQQQHLPWGHAPGCPPPPGRPPTSLCLWALSAPGASALGVPCPSFAPQTLAPHLRKSPCSMALVPQPVTWP